MEDKSRLLYNLLYELLENLVGYSPAQASSLARQAARYLLEEPSTSKRGYATLALLVDIASWERLKGAGYLYFKEEIWRNQILTPPLAKAEDSHTSTLSSANGDTPTKAHGQ